MWRVVPLDVASPQAALDMRHQLALEPALDIEIVAVRLVVVPAAWCVAPVLTFSAECVVVCTRHGKRETGT